MHGPKNFGAIVVDVDDSPRRNQGLGQRSNRVPQFHFWHRLNSIVNHQSKGVNSASPPIGISIKKGNPAPLKC
jgi:hypothetical protein